MNKPVRIKRSTPEVRIKQIIKAAIKVAKRVGYHTMTRDAVAKEAGVSPGLISMYFVTMKQLKCSVMKTAIDEEIIPIIVQGIGLRDPIALSLNEATKSKLKSHFD